LRQSAVAPTAAFDGAHSKSVGRGIALKGRLLRQLETALLHSFKSRGFSSLHAPPKTKLGFDPLQTH